MQTKIRLVKEKKKKKLLELQTKLTTNNYKV